MAQCPTGSSICDPPLRHRYRERSRSGSAYDNVLLKHESSLTDLVSFESRARIRAGLRSNSETDLIQPQRLDGRLVDRSSDNQSLVALVIREGGPRFHA
jgi:hypothetical protein